MNQYSAGGLSGIIEVLLTHPIDYIKTKRQLYIQNNNDVKNFYKDLVRKNRFTDYYTGLSSRIIGIIPMRLLFWGTQNNVKSILEKIGINKWYNFLIIGSSSGIVQTCVDNQIEIMKTSLIEKRDITRKDLIKFDGFGATLYRNVIFVNVLSSVCHNYKFKDNVEKFKYSSTAGLIGSIISQPFDYVKTIKQSKVEKVMYKNYNLKEMSTFGIINVIRKDNPKILFSGGLLRGCLSFCSMGIGFTIFSNLLE